MPDATEKKRVIRPGGVWAADYHGEHKMAQNATKW